MGEEMRRWKLRCGSRVVEKGREGVKMRGVG
jgi:hypothetical protein